MITKPRSQGRRGTILPLLVICIVVLFGFVALAVDVGMYALARCQCQNAADCVALTGARTLSGDPANNNNFANCEPGARTAAGQNIVMGRNLNGTDANQVRIAIGSYTYNATTLQFENSIPPTADSGSFRAPNDNFNLVKATIMVTGTPSAFGQIFGVNTFDSSAVAVAAHRPRDVAVVVDFTGSMRFSSMMGVPYDASSNSPYYNGSGNGGSNNPESVYPKFGPYSSSTAGLLQPAPSVSVGGYFYGASNVTVADSANSDRPPIVRDFYQNAAYATPKIPAFNNDGATGDNEGNPGDGTGPFPPPDSSLNADNLAGGDSPLLNNNNAGPGYAQTVKDVTGSASMNTNFETNGYQQFTGTAFNGYTQGPRYWGKTFFIWPPDPTNDWRQKFFGTTDNTKLWDGNGNWQMPSGSTYTINYSAILSWIKTTGPAGVSKNPFPSQLRAGHIKYYDAIPSSITGSYLNFGSTNERFWKEYIDFVLGVRQTGGGSYNNAVGDTGYGDDFAWGTPQINPPPGDGRYMDYQDNPRRPRVHFWFGPMSMVDYLGNYPFDLLYASSSSYNFMWPGTCHEAPMYACKLGIQASLEDMKNNHPNDFVSLAFFAAPRTSAYDGSGNHRFNAVRGPLSRNYNYMEKSLWFPQATLNADGTDNNTEITSFDSANIPEVPHATGGTCFAYGLMLAYNQFQSTPPGDTTLRQWVPPSATVPEGVAGGLGRRGAQKMIIFETDGLPNYTASANLVSGTPSYYQIRFNSANLTGSEYPTGVSGTNDNDPGVTAQTYAIIDQIKASYSTARKPMRLHCIGFGPIYDSNSLQRAAALTTLQTMQYHGNTQSDPTTPLDDFKIITGSDAAMTTNLQTAISKIMEGSIQVVLIQ